MGFRQCTMPIIRHAVQNDARGTKLMNNNYRKPLQGTQLEYFDVRQAVEDIQQIVWKLKDKNIGILITDHNVQETLSITDRAYLLFEGKILFQGTPEELSENQIVREKYLSNSFVLRRKDFQLEK